ncbi:hypothetical protein LEP1GSC124_1641 [Leptospira interrogans serovar Pyrogenes str. 200701872]|uniref:Uncharacterized protein n=1 Tax=Leptospira interrogans serovar Pyrogenes str. 200701872 TaxID=1193029 RepID=M6ZNE8_LEPIR|nr:hypothetical protein LEP1GSC124_1641 [Leptospira interrogans serovar Pyrogenes str. 200701872]
METLRNLISYELARYFYHHLMEELSKPEPLQIQIGYDGKTSREANRDYLTPVLYY